MKAIILCLSLLTCILSLLTCILGVWLIHIKLEMRSISRQLRKRLSEGSGNALQITLLDPTTIRLAADINRCLKTEETAKVTLQLHEKQFRDSIANISHDLRTPLTSIKGYLQLLRSDLTSPAHQERVRVILKHTDELGDLIEHFFEYACLISDESETNAEDFCLTDETAECLAAAVPQLEARGLAVVPGAFDPVWVNADREKTRRIIQNLVRNCIRHADGDITVNITADGAFASLAVGNPVHDPDAIIPERLFDRFYTVEKSRRKSTGLGLTIVRSLAEQLGGRVTATLSDNNLIFTVQIPLAANH